MLTEIHQQLNGVWVPTYNWATPAEYWPRLVFNKGRGFFEDGDRPVIYSVEHFGYQLISPSVLEITSSEQEFLNDDQTGTEFEESWIECRFYDLAFHQVNNGLFVEIEISWPPAKRMQYCKTDEAISDHYSPIWKFM